MDREASDGLFARPVLRYVAMVKAASDFGLDTRELHAIVRRFPEPEAAEELADALADAILARA